MNKQDLKGNCLVMCAICLFAVVTLGTNFFVSTSPTITDFGNVHAWEVTDPDYDWYIRVVDPNGNHPGNKLTIVLDRTKSKGDFMITDINEVPVTIYEDDPNLYVIVRVTLITPFDRYGDYWFVLDANDTIGNTGRGRFPVKWIDREPPVYPPGGCRKAN